MRHFMSKCLFLSVALLSLTEQISLAYQNSFPADLPEKQWIEFQAAGFTDKACGAIFTSDDTPCCGVPMGGVGTGCIDIDVSGTFGFNSLFHDYYQEAAYSHFQGVLYKSELHRKISDYPPFLGMAISNKTWVLASRKNLEGGRMDVCAIPAFTCRTDTRIIEPVRGVSGADKIRYWGHYPVADLIYETDSPVKVSLKAWSPFIPGDEVTSSAPCAFFEVTLHNASAKAQEGHLAFCFPGPVIPEMEERDDLFAQIEVFRKEYEAQHGHGPQHNVYKDGFRPRSNPAFDREPHTQDNFKGMLVSNKNRHYLAGVLNETQIKLGGNLGRDGQKWASIARSLPEPDVDDPAVSVSVAFSLKPGKHKTVTYVVAWHAPEWKGKSNNFYTAMYERFYPDAKVVLQKILPQKKRLLNNIIAWQQEIYKETQLPVWLRDCLVNNLYLIPETTYWAQAKAPLGDWCYNNGFFGMLESPRSCPQIECIPCTWYGNFPIVYLFPELAKSTLYGYRHYMKPDGEIPFIIGSWGLPNMANPAYTWQVSLNGPCFVHLVDRLWQRTGDEGVLEEFYPTVKKNTIYTMNLRPTPEGPISMPSDNRGMEWFEWGEWMGMATHLGGIRLASLQSSLSMAEAMGDRDFVQQCKTWLQNGQDAMENKMWTGSYYLNFYEEKINKKSTAVMGYQLDGEWASKSLGYEGVFRQDRVPVVLDKIRQCNVAASGCGAINFATPDGKPLSSDDKIAEFGNQSMFLPEVMILAMTYMYAGEKDFGMNMLEDTLQQVLLNNGRMWDLPNTILGNTCDRQFGTDYYQNGMLWTIPAAIAGQDLMSLCRKDQLVDRMLKVGRQK